MAKKPDGFTLYTMDDGASSQLSGLSGMSPYSGPSQSSSNTRAMGGRAPPPHTQLRTNFTTGNAGNRRSVHSPSAAQFHTMNTPPAAAPNTGAAQFAAALSAQQTSIMSKLSMGLIIVCIIAGAGLGALIHNFDVDPAVSKWIKLPGDLYVRAIQCVVIPLVFVNLVVSLSDIIHAGQGQRIGLRVAMLFVVTTAICVAEGIGMGYISRSLLNISNTSKQTKTQAVFGIQCSNGKYLEELANGLVTCSASSVNATSKFVVNDINNAFVRNSSSLSPTGSLTDNLMTVLKMIVPSNIMSAFVNNTLLSIVAFAIPCGVTLAKSFHGPIQLNPLLEFLREVNESLIMMVSWVIRFTPIAVLSLLAGSFGEHLSVMSNSPISLTLKISGLFLGAVVFHMCVVMPALFMACARSNPLRFMMHLTPAYVYSLGCASSMATLPVTMTCIERSRSVSTSIMYFVMSIGASLHMNGSAIYLPMMTMFLADVSGLWSGLGTPQMLSLALAAFLGSLAAAPVPGGSVVMLTTVWSIAFPSTPIPSYYAFLVAADVILDRLVTVCNINGDAMICRIIEEQSNEDLLLRTNPNALRG